MIDVKVLAEEDHRAAHALFRTAIHQVPADESGWSRAAPTFLPGRVFGAYADGTLIGTAMSLPMPMTVPGGNALPSAAVSRVGVRADHTRRGALTALMREQLAAVAAAGEPLASLRASEYPIYGRFGYGVATRARNVEMDPRGTRLHRGAPATGQVRMLEPDELATVLPPVYERIGGRRPGWLRRPDFWWNFILSRPSDRLPQAAVHTSPDGADGLVVYHVSHNPTPTEPWGIQLQVDELFAADAAATAALWRFVLGVDFTNLVRAWLRPVDEPLELLLEDPRRCRTVSIQDEAWLRLVDVPTALAARSWAGDDAVDVGVRDTLLPANTGVYRITPDGVFRVDAAPELECDVAVLARMYLGDVAPSTLAATGWLAVPDPSALPRADALVATGQVPWSGTFF